MPLPPTPPPRQLQAGQRSQVFIVEASTCESKLAYETSSILIEAPNWSLDNTQLLLNGDGKLWSLNLESKSLSKVPLEGVPDVNNDHVLDPDGEHVYVSCNDWHTYRVPIAGGKAELITHTPLHDSMLHFLHGVSPDGKELAFIGLEPQVDGDFSTAHTNIFTVATDGSNFKQLTTGSAPHDGSEYTPDGSMIYFNGERFDGHAQIGRMNADGSAIEQLTFNDNVNWFPHFPLKGKYASYIAFPPGTAGHPADLVVDIMLVEDGKWKEAKSVATIPGGQGSLNVNSWSPDGRFFAYCAYPIE